MWMLNQPNNTGMDSQPIALAFKHLWAHFEKKMATTAVSYLILGSS